MRGWIIFGVVCIVIALWFSYPWNVICVLMLGAYAFLQYRRRVQSAKPPTGGGSQSKRAHARASGTEISPRYRTASPPPAHKTVAHRQ